jgi:RNA-binding protein YlmH
MITTSSFLSPHGRSIAEKMFRSGEAGSVRYGFYGGYADAERVLAVFLPEYIEKTPEEHFKDEPDDNPLTVLRVTLKKGSPELTHRDYLGSLMGLGITRESTGDILVRKDGADIIVLKEMAPFIMMNMEKAGRARLIIEEVSISDLTVPETHRTEVTESVSSLRLDSIVSAAFGLSRGKASEAISGGIVFVNGVTVTKPEKQLSEGDKIVLRGRGKAVFTAVKGTSSKGRTVIVLEKYR